MARRTVSATEARIHLGELLRGVVEDDDEVVVERAGKPAAVLISAHMHRRLTGPKVDVNKVERIVEAGRRMKAAVGNRKIPKPEDVIRRFREERNAP